MFLSRKSKISKIQNNIPKIQNSKHFQNNKLLIRGSFDQTRVLIPKIPRSRRSRTIFPKSKIPNISRTISYSFVVRLVERVFLPRKFKISKIQNNKYRYLFDICYFKLPKIQDFKYLYRIISYSFVVRLVEHVFLFQRFQDLEDPERHSKKSKIPNISRTINHSFSVRLRELLVLIARNGTEFIRAGSWSAD